MPECNDCASDTTAAANECASNTANTSTDEVGHIKACVATLGGLECADSICLVSDSSK